MTRLELFVMPVLNGVLPRPDGGSIKGAFTGGLAATVLEHLGIGGTIFLCPFLPDRRLLYHVGVIGRIEDIWSEEVVLKGKRGKTVAVFVAASGRGRAKARGFRIVKRQIVAQGVEAVDFAKLRGKGHPVICGAGWQPAGGFTECGSPPDVTVTIYGVEYETGARVGLKAELGGVVPPERAHTVEHAIIRSLNLYGLCSPRTLMSSFHSEAAELKDSLELGFRFRLPEIFGVTSSGSCGNPLTNLAHFHLASEIAQNLAGGSSWNWSVTDARRVTLSRLADDLELSTSPGLRALQGFKFGMLHDDSGLSLPACKKILQRFPLSPWNSCS